MSASIGAGPEPQERSSTERSVRGRDESLSFASTAEENESLSFALTVEEMGTYGQGPQRKHRVERARQSTADQHSHTLDEAGLNPIVWPMSPSSLISPHDLTPLTGPGLPRFSTQASEVSGVEEEHWHSRVESWVQLCGLVIFCLSGCVRDRIHDGLADRIQGSAQLVTKSQRPSKRVKVFSHSKFKGKVKKEYFRSSMEPVVDLRCRAVPSHLVDLKPGQIGEVNIYEHIAIYRDEGFARESTITNRSEPYHQSPGHKLPTSTVSGALAPSAMSASASASASKVLDKHAWWRIGPAKSEWRVAHHRRM